jgi:uncharacterized protein (TIGR02996 family)
MSRQHDALYRAICLHPDEDTPRLAYADLIEEEGDSTVYPEAGALRAAFIRKQIEFSRAPEYDPLHISTRQLCPDSITGALMMHTFPKLTAPSGYDWGKYEFRRGFPWKLGIRSLEAFLHSDLFVFETAPIQALDIDARNKPDLGLLADWPQLRRIRRLEFTLGRFGADAVARLGNSPLAGNLTEIAFEYDGITAGGLESLARSAFFARLDRLELRSNVIPPALLVDALAAVQEPAMLTRLALPANRLHHADAAHLFALPVMRGLQYLDLSNNTPLGVAGTRALASSGVLSSLRVLNLSRTLPGVPGIKELVGANRLAGVRSLDLSVNRLGPVAIKLLTESAAVCGLRVLNLANNPVQDAGAIALANAEPLSGLLELDLGNAELTDAGALALADSPHLGGLLRLNLATQTLIRPFSGKTRRALAERFGQRVTC